jgi:hypothetical protein
MAETESILKIIPLILNSLPCGGALRFIEDDEKGIRCIVALLCYPVIEEHKYEALVHRVFGWTQG